MNKRIRELADQAWDAEAAWAAKRGDIWLKDLCCCFWQFS